MFSIPTFIQSSAARILSDENNERKINRQNRRASGIKSFSTSSFSNNNNNNTRNNNNNNNNNNNSCFRRRINNDDDDEDDDTNKRTISTISTTTTTTMRRRRRDFAFMFMTQGMYLTFISSETGTNEAKAVMGSIAGRVPGFSKPDSTDGSMTYTRPELKSGGHGIGWTEITPYSVKLREGWEEVAVSIADPGGTEIDTRFKSELEGDAKIVLAPVLRFANVEDGENPSIEDLVPITNFIFGFAPEVLGEPVQEEQIKEMYKDSRNGLTHYNYEISNSSHWLVSATVWKKRVYLCAVHADGRRWRKAEPLLRDSIQSFIVIK